MKRLIKRLTATKSRTDAVLSGEQRVRDELGLQREFAAGRRAASTEAAGRRRLEAVPAPTSGPRNIGKKKRTGTRRR
jgi:hypothetical protein